MEINLKSSVGRSFAALLDPVTVGRLLEFQTRIAQSAVYTRVREDLKALGDERLIVNDEHTVTLMDENDDVVDAYTDKYREVPDTYAASVMEAFRVFKSEFELLQTGAGSERATMEAFVGLCELLQG